MTNTRSHTGEAAGHKMITAILITLAVLITMISMTAVHTYAASPSAIEPGDLIEVGKADAEGYTGVPVWRVLDKKEDGSMLLMSEYLWRGNGTDPTYKPRFINTVGSSGTTKVVADQVLYWRGTDAEIWADTFRDDILSGIDGMTIVPTTKKVDEEFYYEQTLYPGYNKELHFAGTDPINSVLYENGVFFLSAEEVVHYFKNPLDRIAYLPETEKGEFWLLRSSQAVQNWASEVKDDGEITAVTANTGQSARPVFWAKFDDTVSFVSSTDSTTGRTLWTIGEDPEEEAAEGGQSGSGDKADTGKTGADDKTSADKKSGGTNDKADAEKTSAAARAKKVKTVTVNVPTVTAKAIDKAVKKKGGSKKYVTKIVLGKKVKSVKAKAFSKYKNVTTVEVRTKKLTKKSVKNALKGSKVKKIKVRIGKKSVNKKYVKKYNKIFTKKNSGRKVTVK